jgi:hypothetical protein
VIVPSRTFVRNPLSKTRIRSGILATPFSNLAPRLEALGVPKLVKNTGFFDVKFVPVAVTGTGKVTY